MTPAHLTITGTVNGHAIDSTATIKVSVGAASPDTSTITADPEAITTDGAATITVQQLGSASSRQVDGGDTVTLTAGDEGQLEVEYAGGGAYIATFDPKTPGLVTITGTVNGHAIDSTATIKVSVGAASPDTSTITADPEAITTDGAATITVQQLGSASSRQVDGGDTVTLTAGDEGQLEVEYAGGGAYIATFDPKTPGLVTITGTVNGHAIDSTATIKVSVGAASPDTSTITADPEAITTDGAATITVQQLGSASSRQVDGGDTVTLTAGDEGQLEVEYAGGGAYIATFDPKTPGLVTITGTVNGHAIDSTATIEVSVGAASPDTSTITADAEAITTDGAATITVQLKDAKHNNLTDGGDEVTLATDAGEQLEVEYAGDGAYTATFEPKTPGLVTITGTVNGDAIDSRATIKVSVGSASPDTSTITADPEAITTDETALITVQLRDAKGNELVDGDDTVTLTTTHGTLTPVTDNGDGTYTAVFSATTPGTATISGNVNSADMIDTVDIEVSVGKANTLTSTVTSGEASITAGESTTITVQLKDAHGNALVTGGDSVELETDLGTVTPVVDNDDGTYTATFSSTASGTATIAGKLNGQEIASFVEVEVLPGPADAEQSI